MPNLVEQPEGEPLIRAIAMPADTNPSGDIFGGWLMAQMDLAGANAAVRRARGRCVTVAVDGMVFHEPVFVGDEVSLYAGVLQVGKTSMTIRVEAWRRSRTDEVQHKVTEATFTFVAVDLLLQDILRSRWGFEGFVVSDWVSTAYEELVKLADQTAAIRYAAGYTEEGATTEELLDEARRQAKAVEVAIVFAGLPDSYESEGFDRLRKPGRIHRYDAEPHARRSGGQKESRHDDQRVPGRHAGVQNSRLF
jgi:acyl-CoA thioesterase YciA